MNFSLFSKSESQKITDLFNDVFSASEGKEEGQAISVFVSNLIATTRQQDLIGCIAEENEILRGCIFFSRFTVPSGQMAFILSPVAVATEFQSRGVGQKLIHYGLEHLKTLNVSLAFTYGDPAYYCKTGFEQIDEAIVRAPYSLSQPIGWQVISLDGQKIHAMTGPTQCVEALSDPGLW